MDRTRPCSVQYSDQFSPNLWNEKDNVEKKNGTDALKASKVHVNPNFNNGKSLVIHVNPRIYQNRKIHVNPKIMKDIVPVDQEPSETPVLPDHDRISLGDRLLSQKKHIQKSIHVNRNLVKKLSMTSENAVTDAKSLKPVPVNNTKTNSPLPSKTSQIHIPDKKSSTPSTPRLLAISQRKLVRIGSNVRTPTNIQSPGLFKKLNRKSLSVVRVNSKKTVSPMTQTKLNPSRINKYKMNAYKTDRTGTERKKRKKLCIPDARIRNINKGLVTIGGVKYQSSRTQLVRSNPNSSVQKKKSGTSSRGDAFVMAKNGKKLHRLCTQKEEKNVTRFVLTRNSLNRRSIVKKVPNSIVQTSHKNVVSYKAKQRSLQILRDKLRKNYIPCLLFRRFGYCAKQAKGTCPKLHDKKQVALCKNFLQGKCLLDDCPLSHNIGPEKMPTCRYFLEGCCIRDACPYLHVKVSPNTPVCAQFLRGYCADGDKCKQRHTYICPEFEKSGICAKGKYCPYPHKLKTSAALVSKTRVGKIARKSTSGKRINENGPSIIVRASEDNSRKRYYDEASPSDEQLAEMRQNILKQMKCMKQSLGITEVTENTEDISDEMKIDKCDEETDCTYDERPKRTPIGPLPAYIPIN